MRKKWLSMGGHPKKIIEKGGHVNYFSNALKWHNVLILKNCSRTNIEERIQIYYKLPFRFEITFDDKKYL